MTLPLLRSLRERYAFDGTPRFDDLGVFHVPFESMGAGLPVETRMHEGVQRGERIALIAESGCGKSSVISHLLGPTADGVFPVLMPVHSLRQEAANADRVADMALAQLARDVATAMAADGIAGDASGARREITRSAKRTRRVGARVPAGLLSGDVAEEIRRQVSTSQPIGLPEKIEVISQCLQPLHRDALMPVFVFDDSDRWSASDEDEIVEGFFERAIRWLTDLPAAVVVATHTYYLGPGRGGESLLQFLDTRVELPRLPSADQLGRILMERVRVHLENEGPHAVPAELGDVVAESAVNALFDQYKAGASLRRVLQLAHIALAEATDAGAEVILDHHIAAATRA